MSKPKPIRVDGAFRLLPPYDKYKSHRIEWFNQSKRQTDGLSTRTTDRETAEAAFDEHVLKNSKKKLKDEPMLNSCNRYYLEVGQKLASADTFQQAQAAAIKVLTEPDKGNFGPMVSEMGPGNQKKLINTWRENGVGDACIIRWMGCLWTAMNHAAENEHLNKTVIPKRLSSKRWNAHIRKRKLVLTPAQLATLLDCACLVPNQTIPRFSLHKPRRSYTSYSVWWTDPLTSKTIRRSLKTSDEQQAALRLEAFEGQYIADHPVTYTEYYGLAFRTLLSLIATGSRQIALVELIMPKQIDCVHGIMHLNPEDRQQTKKHRPTIPMAPTFAQWLETWEPLTPEGHLLGSNGVALASTGSQIRALRERTGIRFSAHTIRHTVATWLSGRVSALWERDQFMGWQRSEGSEMGSVYSHYDPKYLRQCSTAIQELLEAIAQHMVGNLLRRARVDQPLPPHDGLMQWIGRGLATGFSRLLEGPAEQQEAPPALSATGEGPTPPTGPQEATTAPAMLASVDLNPARGEVQENERGICVARKGYEAPCSADKSLRNHGAGNETRTRDLNLGKV